MDDYCAMRYGRRGMATRMKNCRTKMSDLFNVDLRCLTVPVCES